VGVDDAIMLWPVAALAGLLLTFVIVYGSIVQARLNTRHPGTSMSTRDPVQ
jgi:hypothetical protein